MFPFIPYNYDYNYNYNYDFSWFFNQNVTLWDGFTISMFQLLYYGLSIALWLLCFVFQAVGLYTMAKQQGLRGKGLAWVPVLNMYMLGKVSDSVSGAFGRPTHKRVSLLTMHIILSAASYGLLFFLPAVIQFLIQFFTYSNYYQLNPGYGAPTFTPVASVLTVLFTSLGVIALAVVYYVFLMRALYVIFKDRSERNCALMIVLCIFINYAIGPCLFAVRNNQSKAALRLDYHRRQQEAQQAAYQQAYAVYEEPSASQPAGGYDAPAYSQPESELASPGYESSEPAAEEPLDKPEQ
ncbi:MAG: hypothetical protein ACOX6U_00795 [Oscillospiraceae bacterium]|jgi:hypothetical protein